MWQQIWFVVNFVFVALLIVFMFAHRAVITARQQGDPQRLLRASRTRLAVGVLCAAAFAAMAASFLIAMRMGR
ncbi:hypothetical protein [Paenibacillus humicola]|uniref:hypothetical protein n=1 Tax=Paenibacillus humicola TaxID=3110540 RepID=UPI00237A2FE4|nr:hypothetical protein [Paenibacillus humicola]